MTVVTNLRVPGDQFELGRLLRQSESVEVTFERTVPTGTRAPFPYMWVETDDHSTFTRLVEDDQVIDWIDLVHRDGNRGLYSVNWSDETDQFLGCLRETEVVVLNASGCVNSWAFELRFDSHGDVSRFQRVCKEHNISLSVDRIVTESVSDSPEERLTKIQRETIELALRRGYFNVPRETSMVDLADELGVSDQAVSARIRRAMKHLSEEVLGTDASTDRDREGPIDL